MKEFLKIVYLLLLINSSSLANKECDANTDALWEKLDKEYRNTQKGYKDYHGGFSCLKIRKQKDKALLVGIYCKPLDNEEEKLLCSMVVAVADLNKSIIEQSYLHVDNLEMYPSQFSFDFLGDYPDVDGDYRPFGLMVTRNFFGAEQVESSLFIYEKENNKLKPLLSDFLIKKIVEPYDDGMKEEMSSIEWVLVHVEGRKKYAPLAFSPYYTYRSDKEWKVNLADINLVYKNGKYEVVSKAKPIFDLKEVEANTQKGLRYKKIVLEAMLFELPLTRHNENSYRTIMYNLYEHGHKKEGDFLYKVLKPLESWEHECGYDADWFSLALEKKHKRDLVEYERLLVYEDQRSRAFCSKADERNEAVIVRPYSQKGQKNSKLSFLIAVVDVESNKIKESYFHKDAMEFSYISLLYKLDRESYRDVSYKRPFAISIQEMFDGPPTDTKTHLFLYERENGTLRAIMSDVKVEESWQEMGSQNKSHIATLKKSQMNFDYPPLVYKQNYSYYYESEGYKGEHEWKVKLDDMLCSYENDKYECKQKPLFELRQIAKNLGKGLKYKEIVLRAMLWETKVTEKNVEDAKAIVDYLTEHKQHLTVAKILLERVNGIRFQNAFKEIHTEVEDVKPLLFKNKGVAKALSVVPWLQKKLVTFKEGDPLKVYAYKKDGKVEFVFFALVKNEVGDSFVNLYRINQKNHSYELIKEYKEKVAKSKEDWRGFDPYYFYYRDNTIYFKSDIAVRYKTYWKYVYSFNPNKELFPRKKETVFDFGKGYFYNHNQTIYVDISGDISLVWGNGKKDKQFIAKDFKDGFFVDEISWSEDDSVIYFDNHGMGTACIWRYDIYTHELSKIVPEHEAEVPFAFTYVDKEYVVYIEGKDIKVATENTIMNPKIKDSCEDYASISSKEPKQCIKVKKKSWLYNKADVKGQSKKFLIKNDVALILKRKEGWYKIYFHHSKLNTKTTLWIKEEDVERLK